MLQIVHYGQEVASGGFNQYDHGEEENMEARLSFKLYYIY